MNSYLGKYAVVFCQLLFVTVISFSVLENKKVQGPQYLSANWWYILWTIYYLCIMQTV